MSRIGGRLIDNVPSMTESQGTDSPRRRRWERAAEWPLTIAALIFLAVYAIPILNPDLSPELVAWAHRIEWATWALFALDYFVRLALTEDRMPWVLSNWFDLIVVVVPMLRPLRLLRLVTMLTTLHRYAGSAVRGRISVFVFGGSILIVFVGALAMLDRERGADGANITNFGDAVWWAFTTITTVGYGDRYPVTTPGRWIAAGVMIAGIALLGTVTATFASWLIERVRAETRDAVREEMSDAEPA
jgi:voltage-gated potassium channel